jgi:hypothetical protein
MNIKKIEINSNNFDFVLILLFNRFFSWSTNSERMIGLLRERYKHKQ